MSFAFGSPRRRRGPSLTPMIDVVFLLLVFFMLAARLGPETAIDLSLPRGGGDAWQGPPRLVSVLPGEVRLNGQSVEADSLAGALDALMSDPGDPIILQTRDGADLQRLLDVMAVLRRAGLTRLVLVD